MADAFELATGDVLVLDGPLTADTADATRLRMLALAGAPACVIHAAEVTQLDGAGAQLLYAFIAELARHGAAVEWASASVYLVEAARMLGMDGHLGLRGQSEEVTSWQP
jgi:ABC-type transporter Mla MlaB component